jgi:hypothetical protein
MEKYQPGPEIERSNVQRGLDIARAIAREHEKELRETVESGEVVSYTDRVANSSITKEELKEEFERRAQAEGVNLEDFYTEAPRQTLTGHRFELLAIVQIITA